jgi:excinuclease ABC subunit A
MYQEKLVIRGAKEHNLKNIDVVLPRFKLVVITGVSGSGKSSLAFDTLYAEGQRRYVESLSAYARQFIGQMEKPKVDFIGGLSPAIAIEQKAVSKNPRSTVATVTEIYDYLRVLFARIGTPHCPQCGREVYAQSAQEIVDQIAALPEGQRFQILAPLARNRKGTFQDVLAQARADGFARVRIDGEVRELSEKIKLDKKKKHDIELVVDRLIVAKSEGQDRDEFASRLTDSVETALRLGDGLVAIDQDSGDEWLLSEQNSCPICGLSFPELTPAMFSFNSPLGMCPDCMGLAPRLSLTQTGSSIWKGRFIREACSLGGSLPRRSEAVRIAKQSRSWSSLGTTWTLRGRTFLPNASTRSCMVASESSGSGRESTARGKGSGNTRGPLTARVAAIARPSHRARADGIRSL